MLQHASQTNHGNTFKAVLSNATDSYCSRNCLMRTLRSVTQHYKNTLQLPTSSVEVSPPFLLNLFQLATFPECTVTSTAFPSTDPDELGTSDIATIYKNTEGRFFASVLFADEFLLRV